MFKSCSTIIQQLTVYNLLPCACRYPLSHQTGIFLDDVSCAFAIAVAAVCLAVFLALGNHQLQNSTEPRVAGIAMEMHLSGNWITPKLNNQPFLEKPPMSVAGCGGYSGVRSCPMGGETGFCLRRPAQRVAALQHAAAFRPAGIRGLGSCFHAGDPGQLWSNSRQVGEDALLALG